MLRLSEIVVLVAANFAAIASFPAAAQESPLRLSPSTPWSLNYAEDSCALSRTFGEGRNSAILELRQYAPGTLIFATVISGEEVRRRVEPEFLFSPIEEDARVSGGENVALDSDLNAVRMQVWTMLKGEDDRGLLTVDPIRDALEGSVETIEVNDVFLTNLVLEVGPVQQPMEAMRACLVDLLGQWGLDGEAHTSLSRSAEIDFDAPWLSEAMRSAGRRGRRAAENFPQAVLFIVETDGSISECRALTPTVSPYFADPYCEHAVEAGRLEPAIDGQGEAMRSFFVQSLYVQRVTSLQR